MRAIMIINYDDNHDKIIMSFKNKKSPGIDNIGPKILKEICSDIVNPLAHIFSLSFSA